MSYQNASQFSNSMVPMGPMNPQFELMPPGMQAEQTQEGGPQQARKPKAEPNVLPRRGTGP